MVRIYYKPGVIYIKIWFSISISMNWKYEKLFCYILVHYFLVLLI